MDAFAVRWLPYMKFAVGRGIPKNQTKGTKSADLCGSVTVTRGRGEKSRKFCGCHILKPPHVCKTFCRMASPPLFITNMPTTHVWAWPCKVKDQCFENLCSFWHGDVEAIGSWTYDGLEHPVQNVMLFSRIKEVASSTLDIRGRIQRGENRLKNRLRIRLRLNFDSMTCLSYLFLDFFQYRKSQADSQAVFQAVFSPSGSDPRGSIEM